MKEENIRISELKLIDLKDLADLLNKIRKTEDKEVKKKADTLLLKVLEYIEKAMDNEIITAYQYQDRFLKAFPKEALEKIKESKKFGVGKNG